jgi:aminotransferase|tara:strand:+ start:4734 stop:5867 length:1134 start_codon:yes stop_codon:yes gene_type:complete
MINIFQPSLGEQELQAIKEVFESNWIGPGPKTAEFEERFSRFISTDRENVTMTNSCTEGMFQVLDWILEPGDEVIIPTIGFVGAANAVIGNGGTPVFCDVDPLSLNTTAAYIEEKITDKTRAVLLIHYAGWSCDMDPIIELCEEKEIWIIEDNACSVATTYKGQPTGTLGDFGVWSFDSMKILVTGDGSIIHAKDPDMLAEIKTRSYLGLLSQSGYSSSVDQKWWEYDISYPGRRSVVNDITSAIGMVQLSRLEEFIDRRKQIHDYYNAFLGDRNWIKTPTPIYESGLGDRESSYYMYWIQLQDEDTRDKLAVYLKENNIYTTFRYYPLHLVKYYDQYHEQLPNAEKAANTTLCIPLHQALTVEEVEYVAEKIRSFK